MAKKASCKYTPDELRSLYITDNRTYSEMCDILGVKSQKTVARILHENGIETNKNKMQSSKTMQGRSDNEFRAFLVEQYNKGFSLDEIAKNQGVTRNAINRYFVKYNIPKRSKTDLLIKNPQFNPNWRGGKRSKDGYVLIYAPNHPKATANNTVYEHQLVMEQHIGRYLKKGEVVHHIDGNRSNNDISNLLLLTNSDHAKLHAILRRSKKLMSGK